MWVASTLPASSKRSAHDHHRHLIRRSEHERRTASRVRQSTSAAAASRAASSTSTPALLIGDRFKLPTPQPATPDAVAKTVAAVVREFGWTGPLGVTYPGVVTDGIVRTAANVDKGWIGTNARDAISAEARRAGHHGPQRRGRGGSRRGEVGAGRDNTGVIVLLTFGTGIGSAVIHNGRPAAQHRVRTPRGRRQGGRASRRVAR